MAVFAAHINRIQRNNMPGTLKKSPVLFFILFQILFSELAICTASMDNETIRQSIKPIIYPIPLVRIGALIKMLFRYDNPVINRLIKYRII